MPVMVATAAKIDAEARPVAIVPVVPRAVPTAIAPEAAMPDLLGHRGTFILGGCGIARQRARRSGLRRH